jgi:hypothetical protein
MRQQHIYNDYNIIDNNNKNNNNSYNDDNNICMCQWKFQVQQQLRPLQQALNNLKHHSINNNSSSNSSINNIINNNSSNINNNIIWMKAVPIKVICSSVSFF